MVNKILIIGGTGMLGQPVTARLMADEYPIRVMTHSPVKAERIFGKTVELFEGDVTDRESLKKPMQDCDAVYINLGSKMNPPDYERVEYLGTANIASVAAEMGIKHIIMISGLSVGLENSKYPFMAFKAKAEKALIESGAPYTIMRCCWFFESLPLFVIDKRATVFGKQKHPRSWIAAADYAPMVSKAFAIEEAKNKIFHIRGIDRFTIPEALSKFCEIMYPKTKISFIPLWLMSTVTKFSRKSPMKGVAQFMKYFDRTPDREVLDDAEKNLGPALTTLQDWAENYKIYMMTK